MSTVAKHAWGSEQSGAQDVGFDEGDWSRSVAANHPRRPIHAFAQSRSVIKSRREFAPDGAGYTFHPLALFDAPGRSTFDDYGVQHGSKSLGDRRHELGNADHCDVEITTLDAWSEQYGINEISVLKIDAEGFDLNIMDGGRGFFEREAIDMVVFEYASGWFSTGRTLMETTAFMQSVGYQLFRLSALPSPEHVPGAARRCRDDRVLRGHQVVCVGEERSNDSCPKSLSQST